MRLKDFEGKKILHIEKDEAQCKFIESIFKGKGDLLQTNNFTQASTIMNKERIDYILCHYTLTQKESVQFIVDLSKQSKLREDMLLHMDDFLNSLQESLMEDDLNFDSISSEKEKLPFSFAFNEVNRFGVYCEIGGKEYEVEIESFDEINIVFFIPELDLSEEAIEDIKQVRIFEHDRKPLMLDGYVLNFDKFDDEGYLIFFKSDEKHKEDVLAATKRRDELQESLRDFVLMAKG
jgi:hypothetical protein